MVRERSNLHKCSVWLLVKAQTCIGVVFGEVINPFSLSELALSYSDLWGWLVCGGVAAGPLETSGFVANFLAQTLYLACATLVEHSN